MTVLVGDCRDSMRRLIAEGVRVQCCVTSPPYWSLRDYGVDGQLGLEPAPDCLGWATGGRCGECYICRMVEVFSLVRDLLTDDGTLWLNLGDTYASAGGAGWQGKNGARSNRRFTATRNAVIREASRGAKQCAKPKDLVGIPWRAAFALQADGWFLRQDIIWHKPNPMPESVRDRCTKAHEYMFLLSKSERYYFDRDSIAEQATSSYDPDNAKSPDGWDTGAGGHGAIHRSGREKGKSGNKARKPASELGVPVDIDGRTSGAIAGSVPWEGTTRNKRSVWTVTTQPYPEAHFATFPPALVEPCILAGSRPGDTVFDPFMGSGTTAQTAQALGRKWIGCELNPEYVRLIKKRTAQASLALEGA